MRSAWRIGERKLGSSIAIVSTQVEIWRMRWRRRRYVSVNAAATCRVSPKELTEAERVSGPVYVSTLRIDVEASSETVPQALRVRLGGISQG